jgi:hypothetical protein
LKISVCRDGGDLQSSYNHGEIDVPDIDRDLKGETSITEEVPNLLILKSGP